MSPVDTTWLRMDHPGNLMTILGIMLLEGPVDVARLGRALAKRILVYDRFRQRVETLPTGTWWRDDEHFDVGHHIKHIRLPGAGDKAELERFVADLAGQPLDPAHPLWQFHIVEGYEGGAAVVVRIHHAIGDGIALIGVMLSLTDDHARSAATRSHHGVTDDDDLWQALFGPVGSAVGQGLRLSADVWRESLGAAASPARAVDLLRSGTGIAAELAYLLLMPDDSRTRFKGVPSGDKRVAWTDPIPLPEVKAVSRALGCSVNDMLLAAVAGALNAYLRDKGDPTHGVEVRALVPINLRRPDSEAELGNRFGIIAVELPVGRDNPLERLYEVRRRMDALKKSYEPPVTLGLLAALGYAPKLVQDKVFDLLLSRASAVMTNVPGPQHTLHLAGSRMKQVMFWVPQAGNIGMGVSILSFDGQVQFGLITDAAMVPDPEAIIAGFRPEFEKLLYHVLMEPWDDDAAEPAAAAAPAAATEAPAPRRPARKSPPPARPAARPAARRTPAG